MSLSEYDAWLLQHDPGLRELVLQEIEQFHLLHGPGSTARRPERLIMPSPHTIIEGSVRYLPMEEDSMLLLPPPAMCAGERMRIAEVCSPPPDRTELVSAAEQRQSSIPWVAIVGALLLVLVLLGSWATGSLPSLRPTQPTASQQIQRLNQLDRGQYQSDAQYQRWSASACSAAAMTEVINAYGHRYRLADILQVEIEQQQISPEQGLLNGVSSIVRTVAPFGFRAIALSPPSLEEILQHATAGTPVIVGFRDSHTFPNGHILVVRGGERTHVDMVDSSVLHLGTISAQTFASYFDGFAVLLTPNGAAPATSDYSVLGPPSISAAFIDQVLEHYHSPAAGKGQALYDLGVRYGVDPVFALAFFMHESTFGTRGEATVTLALGNERCLPDRPCIDQDRGGYAQFSSWEDGMAHWYLLITGPLYKGAGLTTVDTIIPRYAPSRDNNDERAYRTAIKDAVESWRMGKIAV